MTITINSTNYNLNIFEYDTAKAFEDAPQAISDLQERIKGKTLSEQIKVGCTTLYSLLDKLLGIDSKTELFGGKYDLTKAVEVWQDVTKQLQNQESDVQSLLSD